MNLERWLRHEAIEARPAPSWERAGKWMRRRPALTALLLVCGVATAGFILLRLDSEARLKRERDQVVLSERRAHAAAVRAAAEARRAETNELSARLHLYVADILLAQGDTALVLPAHAKATTCLAFSSDGATLVTGGRDGRIRFWNAHTGAPATLNAGARRRSRDDDWHPQRVA